MLRFSTSAPWWPAVVLCRAGLLLSTLLLAGPGRGWAQAPAFTQAVGFNPSRGGGTSECRALATDAAGNQYVAGSYEDTLALANAPRLTATGRKLLVAKRSPTGAWLWVVQTGGSGGAAGFGVAVDAGGNVVVTGGFGGTVRFDTGAVPIVLTSPGTGNVFVAKLAGSTGACLWAAQTSSVGSSTTSYSNGTGVALDAAGNALVTGTFDGITRFATSPAPTALAVAGSADVFVAKFGGSTGACAWAVQTRGVQYEYPAGIAVDAGGNALVAGHFVGTLGFGPASGPTAALTSAGREDGFVAKFGGSTGACAWAVQVGGSGGDYATAVATDAAGNALLTGGFAGPASFATRPVPTVLGSAVRMAGFVAKLEAGTGHCAWAVQTSAGGIGAGTSVAADANGNAVVVGSLCDTMRFATRPAPTLLGAPGACGAFIARYGAAAGACAWAVPVGGNGSTYCHAIAVDASGRAVVAGRFRDTAVFGNLTVVGGSRAINGSVFGVDTGFLAVLTGAGTLSTAPLAPLPAFALFPNPARSVCQVQGAAAGAAVVVLDALGRPLARARTDASGTARLALPAGLAPGFYLVRCGGQTRRLAVE